MVMLGYAIWKFRAKPGDESDGEPIHGNTKLEIAWTVIPTVIVLFGAGYSWIVLDDIEAKAADRMRARRHRRSSSSGPSSTRSRWSARARRDPGDHDQLHVPVDRQLEVHLTALDVLHSFWVPEWRIKRDAVPAEGPGERRDRQHVRRHPRRGGHLQPRSAPSSAASATRRCGRRSWSSRRRSSTSGSTSRRRPRRGGGGGDAASAGIGLGGTATLAAALKRPGLARARLGFLLGGGLRLRARRRPARDLRARDLPDRADRLPARDRARDHRPARLPGRARLLRLLVPLGRRARRPSPTTTPSTARSRGATTSSSTPITR